jgi:hypothetical protein
MRARDFFWILACALGGVLLAYLLKVALGGWPNLALISGIIIMSVGLGLVAARFSRLGPFEGELGAPWFENDLRETLSWEYDRAARYGRIVTVLLIQRHSNAPHWDAIVRAVDRVIDCRNGWTVLILPETTRDGADSMLARLNEHGAIVQSSVLQFPMDVESRDELPQVVTDVIRRRTPRASGAPVPSLALEATRARP